MVQKSILSRIGTIIILIYYRIQINYFLLFKLFFSGFHQLVPPAWNYAQKIGVAPPPERLQIYSEDQKNRADTSSSETLLGRPPNIYCLIISK